MFALLAIPTIASAHGGNNDSNVVHACIGNVSKAVRIVPVDGSCLRAETPTHWAIQGPQGPPGTDGTNGTNGTNGIDGINGTNGTNGIDGTGATRPDGPCFNNTSRYVDCGNGTVTDTVTGLIWLKDANCFSTKSYSAASQAAAGLAAGQCGLTDGASAGDWRLPTKAEWAATIAQAVALGCRWSGSPGPPSLTDDSGTSCLIAGATSFTGVQMSEVDEELGSRFARYWSSSSIEIYPSHAWYVTLMDGVLHNVVGVGSSKASSLNFVWPVRGGAR